MPAFRDYKTLGHYIVVHLKGCMGSGCDSLLCGHVHMGKRHTAAGLLARVVEDWKVDNGGYMLTVDP